LAVLSALTSGMTYYFIKKTTNQRINFSINFFYFSLTGLLVSGVLALVFHFVPANSDYTSTFLFQDVFVSIFSGMIMFFGQTFFALITVQENSERIAFLKIFDIALAVGLEYYVSATSPNLLSLLGSCLILTGICILFIRKFFLFGNYTDVQIKYNRENSNVA